MAPAGLMSGESAKRLECTNRRIRVCSPANRQIDMKIEDL